MEPKICRRGALLALTLTALFPFAATAQGRTRAAERLRTEFVGAFERPRVPLEPRAVSSEEKSGLIYEKLTVASEAGQRVPILIVHTAGASSPRRPAVVCLHGLGGNKEGLTGYLEGFARRGIVGVAIDHRYHGDRKGDLSAAMIEAYRTGKEHPYVWDTVWDTWRVLDYLQTRPDVDPQRLGVMGISLGGHATWMASADPRVKVAVPCISVCSWKWQIENRGYMQRVRNVQRPFDAVREALGEPEVNARVVTAAWSRWVPGVPDRWDCQDILSAFAPKPLLVIGGDSDPVAPLPGLEVAWAKIKAAYDRAGAADHLARNIAEHSGHTVTSAQQAAIYDWFVRWLRPEPR